MTVREMQMAFETRLQLISQRHEIKEKPDSFTILQFLNKAQDDYLITNFLSKESLQDNVELIQKRSDVLRNLIKRTENLESSTPITPTEVDGGIQLALPTDYLYYIKSFCYATNTLNGTTTKTWTPNRVVKHDELEKIMGGITHKPILRKPCVVFEEDDKLVLYKDRDTDIFNIGYLYLRRPRNLSLQATAPDVPTVGETNVCELDEYTHTEIVELALEKFIVDYKYRLSQAKE